MVLHPLVGQSKFKFVLHRKINLLLVTYSDLDGGVRKVWCVNSCSEDKREQLLIRVFDHKSISNTHMKCQGGLWLVCKNMNKIGYTNARNA